MLDILNVVWMNNPAMKKLPLLICASFLCVAGAEGQQNPNANAQTDQQKAAAESHAAAMAAGYHEALTSYLAQGGSIRTDRRGSRYMEGPIRGLTKAQATAQFNQLWANTSQEIRERYAARALSRGATAEVQIEQQRREEANRRRQQAEAQRNAQQRVQQEKAMRESATVMRSGNRITLNGDQTSGYRIQGDNLYEFSSGAHTHVRSGNLWVPINNSHPEFLDP